MRFSKKTLALALCIIMCMSMTALGTVAYLTDRQSVTNTFTVGDIGIKVDETKVDKFGDPELDENQNPIRTEDGNAYHLIPGKTYVKDPVMTIDAGSEPAYVRMVVTINKAKILLNKIVPEGTEFLPQNYVNDTWNSAIWPCVKYVYDKEADTLTYYFNYKEVVDASAATEDIVLEPLFEEILIPGTLTKEDLADLKGLEITVEGQAIQNMMFDTADAAWKAFGEQYPQQSTLPGGLKPAEPTDSNVKPIETEKPGNIF